MFQVAAQEPRAGAAARPGGAAADFLQQGAAQRCCRAPAQSAAAGAGACRWRRRAAGVERPGAAAAAAARPGGVGAGVERPGAARCRASGGVGGVERRPVAGTPLRTWRRISPGRIENRDQRQGDRNAAARRDSQPVRAEQPGQFLAGESGLGGLGHHSALRLGHLGLRRKLVRLQRGSDAV